MNSTSATANLAAINDYLVRAPKEAVGSTFLARFGDRFLTAPVRKTIQSLLARALAGIAFPACCLLDIGKNLTESFISKAITLVSKNPETRKKYTQNMMQALQKTEKCALGLLASPAGFISPDIVTRHFLSKYKEPGLIEAGGKLYHARGVELFPETKEEVQRYIQAAIAKGQKVTIAGAHFSQNKDTLPTGPDNISLNMKKLNKVTIDFVTKRAKVEAGATWRDVQEAANRHGLAVKVMQASNVFSIGGSIGVNCHGWDHRTGTVSQTVQSMQVLDATGQLKTIRPDDELFKCVVGGHGLFAAVVEAEIELTDNEALVSWGEKVAIKDYANHFYKNILPDDNHRLHLYRLSLDPKNLLKEGVCQTYSRKTDKYRMPSGGVSTLIDEPESGKRLDRILVHIGRSIPFFRALYWNMESKHILEHQKTLRNEIMRPPIYAAFNNSRADAEWLQEYFVKPQELAPFLEKLSQILIKNKVSLLNASVRFVKHDTQSVMTYAKESDHFAIVLFFNQSLAKEEIEKTEKWVREVVDEVIAKDGSYYLPYQHFQTKEQFQACYSVDTIRKRKQTFDPQGLFTNGFYQEYIQE